jgi:hypothetical protein
VRTRFPATRRKQAPRSRWNEQRQPRRPPTARWLARPRRWRRRAGVLVSFVPHFPVMASQPRRRHARGQGAGQAPAAPGREAAKQDRTAGRHGTAKPGVYGIIPRCMTWPLLCLLRTKRARAASGARPRAMPPPPNRHRPVQFRPRQAWQQNGPGPQRPVKSGMDAGLLNHASIGSQRGPGRLALRHSPAAGWAPPGAGAQCPGGDCPQAAPCGLASPAIRHAAPRPPDLAVIRIG